MSLQMSQAEREAFLSDLHVGVISLGDGDRGPLTAPIWYGYEPGGELWVLVGPTSRKARLLAEGTRFSLCAQNEAPPYSYVSVEGPVISISPSDTEKHARPMARRYLGEVIGDQYVAGTPGDSLVVRMRPERWLTVDYAKLG